MIETCEIVCDIMFVLVMFDLFECLIIKDYIHNWNIFFDCCYEVIHVSGRFIVIVYCDNLVFGIDKFGRECGWCGIFFGIGIGLLEKRVWSFGLETMYYEWFVFVFIVCDNGI